MQETSEGTERNIHQEQMPFHSGRYLFHVPQLVGGMRAAATPALWLGLLALCGGMATTAYLWLASIPPLPECKKIAPLAPDSERLYCAERAARSGKPEAILAGFALVKGWSTNHPLSYQINRAMKDWSKVLLKNAREKAEKGDIPGAIALANKIPATSPIHKEVKAAIAGWQQDHNQGKTLKKTFQSALNQQDWLTAEEHILAFSRLNKDEGWQVEVKRLRQQLATERNARQQLQELQWQVEDAPYRAEVLAQAIAQAKQIKPSIYTHTATKASIAQWTQALLDMIYDQLSQQDVAGAIAAAQVLPFEVAPPKNINDLVWFSRAKSLVASRFSKQPLSEQLQQVWVTMTQIGQFRKTSSFYQQSQAVMPQLEQQLQDLTQLQAASSTASLGQIPSFQLAIRMAESITPNRPQRLHAQSLIARWRQDIQRVADRPTLVAAQQLAAEDSVPQLKQAIALAKTITLGRALRSEAQAAIFKWNRQIQTIEDRPILAQATTLASQKKLKEAIQQANKITAGRALYSEAQASVRKWTRLIQVAEDQPTLNRAKKLAEEGKLSEAIAEASKIGYGRALYNDAQSSISNWSTQIEAASQRAQRYAPRRDRGDYYSPPSYAPRPMRRPGRYF